MINEGAKVWGGNAVCVKIHDMNNNDNPIAKVVGFFVVITLEP